MEMRDSDALKPKIDSIVWKTRYTATPKAFGVDYQGFNPLQTLTFSRYRPATRCPKCRTLLYRAVRASSTVRLMATPNGAPKIKARRSPPFHSTENSEEPVRTSAFRQSAMPVSILNGA